MLPKAILFDLDNTLTHRALSIERYAQRFIADYAHAFRDASLNDTAKLIAAADNGGYLPTQSPYSSIRDAVGHTLAGSLPWDVPMVAEQLIEHWVTHFPSATVPMPGAEALLQELERRGMACGVISNGAEHSRRRTIDALPFRSTIQAMICSEAFGRSKPSPDIFQAGADALGCCPEQCWFVGDHPLNDYLGAKLSGMRAVWLEGFHAWPKDMARAHCSIRSLEELLPLL